MLRVHMESFDFEGYFGFSYKFKTYPEQNVFKYWFDSEPIKAILQR